MLITQEDEDEQGELEGDCVDQKEDEDGVKTEVSLNSVIGLSSPKTMKLIGYIGGESVVVMINPGATHNFISTATVKKLGIPVASTKNLSCFSW